MHKKIFFIITLFSLATCIYAQKDYGTITGKVTSDAGEPLSFANVMLKETNNGTAADKEGKFKLIAKPGTYTLEVSFLGYEKESEEVVVRANRITEIDFTLESTSFEIGGIEVVADNEFIPVDPQTKTKVSSGEIEHIQAASLNDVLELTPGVATSNPTLNNVEQATIRDGDPLGTQIMLDGVPVSNRANLQVGVGYSTANSGVDLRSIPAENIEEVEIIRGIPSAQYGDLVDGLLIVKTKAVAQAPRVKFKYNPNVYETNLSGGYKLGSVVLNGNFNIASSDRDYRVEGDGYTRIAAQLNTHYEQEGLSLKNIFYFTRSFDERKEQPGYALREAWYNRDVNLKYTGDITYNPNELSEINAKFSVSYTNQDSYEQQIVSRDNIVISDLVEEGAREGYMVFGSYLGQKWIKGSVWNMYADLNYKLRFFTGEYLNSWIAGVNWQNDFNNGEGIVFDPLYPPTLSVPSPRIRTYDDLPAYNTLSFYLEDKITGRLWKPFTLQLGARYEVYRPNGFDIAGLWGKGDLIEGYNGSFLNPRVNFSFNLFKNTQIRLSYGVTSKSPPMGMVFAQDKYYDIVDTNRVVDPTVPDSNFSIISTHIRKQANNELQAYRQKKYEISLDQQIGNLGFTLTGFINNTENGFESISIPTVFYKKRYPDWPSSANSVPYDTLMDTYSHFINDGWKKVRGFEFSMRTRRLPVINTVFRFDAAYTYGEYGSENGYYFGSQRYVPELGLDVIPMYNDYDNYYKDLLLNYRFEIQAESLGMWLTLHVQQQWLNIDGRRGYDDVLPIGYYTENDELVRIPESERANYANSLLSRDVESYQLNEEDRPNIWLLNIKVSKSLWKGGAISFFVNNFFNNRPLYSSQRRNPDFPSYTRRNIPIFYGIEFHSSLEGLYK